MAKNIIRPSVDSYTLDQKSKVANEALKNEYKNRLIQYINNSLFRPSFIYNDRDSDEWTEYIAVKSNDLYMNNDFTFYHHTPRKVLEYSIEQRGNADWLMQQMEELRVDEWPFPFSKDNRRVYIVGQNGNHRSALFRTIGLPEIMLNRVTKINSFTIDEEKISSYPKDLINLLIRVGLLQVHDGVYNDRFGYLAWILPAPSSFSSNPYFPNLYTNANTIRTICAKVRWVNEVLNPDIPEKYKFLESEFLLVKELSKGRKPLAKFLSANLLKAKIYLANSSPKSSNLEKEREMKNNKTISKLD